LRILVLYIIFLIINIWQIIYLVAKYMLGSKKILIIFFWRGWRTWRRL